MEKMSKNYDVVIIGGGTSGCACAYNCAKLKLKTLLIEKNNFLGGLMTGGLVVPIMKSSVDDLNCDYYKNLVDKAKKYHAQIKYKDGNDGWFNPEVMKIVLEDLLTQEDIRPYLDILFEAEVDSVLKDGNSISSIVLNSNLLSIPIVSKYYIDATGSASFSIKSGCQILNDTKEKQQNTLRFILGNVDIEKFSEFILEVDKDENVTNTYRNDIDTNSELHFTTACTWDTNKIWALDKYLQKGVSDGILAEFDRSYFQIFSIAGTTSQVAFNCPRINNYLDNPYLYSNELINAKQAIYRLYQFVKMNFPGFDNSIITNIATQTGIREQNRVKTKYVYTIDDLEAQKTFETPVLRANYGIDIHSAKKDSSILQKTPNYELPIESLMSFDVKNLYVIGKIIGADFKTHSALRVQKSCMSMGEAVAKHIKTLI
ncbi:MAG: FAD-dependent oxidoreductase [Candidatus Gastranaerophilales bacterium]|nr:FAD-dependent oxidoreductase [Candidatus Gastranaerophilales bacterium]